MTSNVSDLFYTSLSGFTAAGAQLNAAASNIANMNSTRYKASRANVADLPGGGVTVVSVTTDPSHGYIDEQGNEGSNVDPATEMVHMMQGADLYNANGTILRVGDRMMGTLLDIFHNDRA